MELVLVYLDPGHGAVGNPGNESAYCVDEQDFTMGVALDLAQRLPQLGPFEVKLSRQPGELKAYPDRVKEAGDWGADAFVSVHSDVRGPGEPWTQVNGRSCYRNTGHAGFSILWSDESTDPALVRGRERLANRVSTAMLAAGFSAYHGADYTGLYAMTAPGVFVDRHDPEARIRVLRRPTMPSLIVETHHAWDVDEVARWSLPATREAFAHALASALSPPAAAPVPVAEQGTGAPP